MSRTLKTVIVAAIVGLAAAFVGARIFTPQITAEGVVAEAKEESTYERVMRTGKIRCGYATWPPFLYVEPNSGELVGASVDIMEKLADFLDLKIEWTEEVSFGNYLEGLRANRYDMMCITEWPAPGRIKQQAMTVPVYYSTIYAYVRSDDDRFDGDLTRINDPSVKTVMIEGDSTEPLINDHFEQAAVFRLPEMADHSQAILSLVTGKADVVFLDEGIANDYLATNPNTIRQVSDVPPARLMSEAFTFRDEDGKLKGVLDASIEYLISSGQIKKILSQYNMSTYAERIDLDK